jgi:coproporphyrinogen III oxidase
MRPFRSSFRISRALELPHSYAPQRTLRPNHIRNRQLHASPSRRLDLPSGKRQEKPDPLEEWRNPPPSKWPNRIRLLFVPFIGALVYSMVRRALESYYEIY